MARLPTVFGNEGGLSVNFGELMRFYKMVQMVRLL
jgi:hypothetical protein